MICFGITWHNISEAMLPTREKGVEGVRWMEGLARYKLKACSELTREIISNAISILEARAELWGKGQVAVGASIVIPASISTLHFLISSWIFQPGHLPETDFPQQEELNPDWPKQFCVSSLPWPQWLVEEKAHVTAWMFVFPKNSYVKIYFPMWYIWR